MGGLGLQCVTANGTRLLGMSYTTLTNDTTSVYANYVLLIQSNPNPASVSDISWSLVSAYPRVTSYPQDYSPLVCNVDPTTGVFSMMSAFNLTDPSTPTPNLPHRLPGGLQYDPRTGAWSNFTIDSDYHWGDYAATYALFQWPNTTTLFQANVGATSTVNVGKLTADNDGSLEFENVLSWDLNPAIYGYPSRLVYGNNILYQFGTLVANNKTGALRNTLTRIPLSGDPSIFLPPINLPMYDATALAQCTSYIVASYYIDTLYVFCQGVDNAMEPGYGLVMQFKDGDIMDSALSNYTISGIDRLSGAIVQPIGGSNDGRLERFAFITDAPSEVPMESLALGISDFGDLSTVSYSINITDPFGYVLKDPSDHTPAIIGGTIGGVLLLLFVVLFVFIRRRWPQWRRKLRIKIIAMMSTDEVNEFHNDRDHIYKIEAPSSQSFNLDGRDKILVTDDMELEDVIDVGTGYMQEVTFGRHPRPVFVTTLNDHNEVEDGAISRMAIPLTTLQRSSQLPSESESDFIFASMVGSMPPLPATSRATHTPTAPQLYTQEVNRNGATASPPIPRMARAPSHSRKIVEVEDYMKVAEDKKLASRASSSTLSSEAAPPYSQHVETSSLSPSPSFPIPPTPTAPRWVRQEIIRSPHGDITHNNSTARNSGGKQVYSEYEYEERTERGSIDTAVDRAP
ncbi:hypothetical protein EDD21DRAFT_374965 [Dissophora ornata]|nr:hypothetical protein BGZ58_002429 [Dissophora ornata]KAI8601262.1 hypothetical protein EDD21DRAFT_374965 [Dissophora ornata]